MRECRFDFSCINLSIAWQTETWIQNHKREQCECCFIRFGLEQSQRKWQVINPPFSSMPDVTSKQKSKANRSILHMIPHHSETDRVELQRRDVTCVWWNGFHTTDNTENCGSYYFVINGIKWGFNTNMCTLPAFHQEAY